MKKLVMIIKKQLTSFHLQQLSYPQPVAASCRHPRISDTVNLEQGTDNSSKQPAVHKMVHLTGIPIIKTV
jgi:hypothetical protein